MKHIKILGYDYEVRYSPAPEDGGLKDAGSMYSGKQIIFIEQTQCAQAQASTLLHEIIEALNYHLEMELNHDTICGLEAGLYTVLRDNGVDISGLLKGAKSCRSKSEK
jgi:hypothetical protein